MQQFNFGALDFSGIPQHEAQARKAYYDSLRGVADTFGKAAQDVGSAVYKSEQDRMAEEWKRKQWENQVRRQMMDDLRYDKEFKYRVGRNRIEDARYEADLKRRLEDRQRQIDFEDRQRRASEALKNEFLSEYNYDNVGEYGPGARFALSQIKHGPSYADVVAGGSSLANVIAQRDLFRQQQEAEAASREPEDLLGSSSSRLASSGIDIGRLPVTYKRFGTRGGRQEARDRMVQEAAILSDYVSRNPTRATPQMREHLLGLRNAIDYFDSQMRRRKTSF